MRLVDYLFDIPFDPLLTTVQDSRKRCDDHKAQDKLAQQDAWWWPGTTGSQSVRHKWAIEEGD